MSAWIASPEIAQRYAQLGMQRIPQDAREALQRARIVERLNQTSRFLDAPWRCALGEITRGFEWGEERARIVERLNQTSRFLDAPWRCALGEITRGFEWGEDASRIIAERLFARYGATLEEIAQMTERGRRSFVLKLRHGKRSKKTPTARTQERAITEALALREEMNRRVSSPSDVEFVARATHRAVHRALTGEDTRGCKWCGHTNSTLVAGQQVNRQSTSETEREG